MFFLRLHEFFFLILALSSLALAFILPNHYFPWGDAYQDFLSFVAAFSLCVFIFFKFVPVVIIPQMFFLFLVSIVPLLQFLFGVVFFFGDALVASLYLLAFFCMVCAGYSLASNSIVLINAVRIVAAVLIAVSVLSVWIQLNQWLMLSGSIWIVDMRAGGRPFANLAQPNNLATLLCMGLAGVLYFYERRIFGSVVSGVLAFFLMFGIALTQSRTPWVGAVFSIFFIVWKSKICREDLNIIFYIFWVLVYFLFVLGLPLVSEWLYLSDIRLLDRAQSVERWGMWLQLWDAVWLRPWGYGWNQVSVAQVAVSLAHPYSIATEYSHNILLDILIWNGFVLGAVFIVFIAFWLVRVAWFARASESVFALHAVGFVLVHAMLEFPLAYAFFLLPTGFLLGLATAERRSRYEFVVPRWFLGVFVLLGSALLVILFREYRIVEEDHRLMRFESSNIGSLKAQQVAPNVLFLTQLREFIRFARTPIDVNMTNEQLELMRKVVYRYPYAPSLFRYTIALGLDGQAHAARKHMLILRALHGDRSYVDACLLLRGLGVKHPKLLSVLQNLPVLNL